MATVTNTHAHVLAQLQYERDAVKLKVVIDERKCAVLCTYNGIIAMTLMRGSKVFTPSTTRLDSAMTACLTNLAS